MADWIEESDAEAIAQGSNIVAYATANLVLLGLTPAELAPLTGALTAFENEYNDKVAAEAAYDAAVQDAEAARVAYEEQARTFNNQMQSSPTVTDGQRAGMGLPVHDTEPTPVSAPATHPIGEVDTSEKLRHTVNFRDSMAASDSRKKPDGTRGCEIWMKIGGTPPADYKECDYLTTDTRTPHVVIFDGGDAGKTAYYLLRWVSTRNEPGAWSPLAQATVTN